MAGLRRGYPLEEDDFRCTICLDLMNDPTTLKCGHNYCTACIDDSWNHDQAERGGVCKCPQCRSESNPRPALMRNNMLARVVDTLKVKDRPTRGAQAGRSDQTSPAGPELVICGVCTRSKRKRAVMSCLTCWLSYCETHLQSHNQIPGLEHKLVEATRSLETMICSRHDKLLDVFCRTDQQGICLLCTMDEHEGHDTVSAAVERTKKQSMLGLTQKEVRQQVQEREKKLNEVLQAVESLKRSGQAAEDDIERISSLICYIAKWPIAMKVKIRGQQMAAVSRAKEQMERLEQEITELRKRDTELEKLAHTEDNIQFLQRYQSLSSLSVSSELPSIGVPRLQYFNDVTKAASELREKLEDMIKGECTWITRQVLCPSTVSPTQ